MKKVVLVIMDGWGLGKGDVADAITKASTPFIDSLYAAYPHSKLLTSGANVGLPDGQMGNSEVGHLNIGAGRIVYQDLVRINKEIEANSFCDNAAMQKAFEYCKQHNKPLHLMGLVSDGGVHSHIDHLIAICHCAKATGIQQIYLHAFLDGRDTDPHSGKIFINRLITETESTGALVATISGRYYSMDRDKRWERIKLTYDAIVNGIGEKATIPIEAIQNSYDNNVTDEFMIPTVLVDPEQKANAKISDGDAVICFNFRTDRCREITQVLTQLDMPAFQMKALKLHFTTMTNYDKTYTDVNVMFDKQDLSNTLGEALARFDKTQLRIAETEKYPHVSFFFSGGREAVFDGEERIMIPSPKVATYDLKPEMSAYEVRDRLCAELEKAKLDFVCINFANTDMVGHTGNYEAIVKAVETTDTCVKSVVETGLRNGYSFIITADHGNADFAINSDGTPNTAHTTNPVPCILIDSDFKQMKDGILADLAPTVLHLMGLKIPIEMTGNVLI